MSINKNNMDDKMLRIKKFSQNLMFILSLDFLTLLIVDRLNPAMSFINNSITKPLIPVYAVLLIINSLFSLDIMLEKTEHKALSYTGIFFSVVELLLGAVTFSIGILKKATLTNSKKVFLIAVIITLVHTVFMIAWLGKSKVKETKES